MLYSNHSLLPIFVNTFYWQLATPLLTCHLFLLLLLWLLLSNTWIFYWSIADLQCCAAFTCTAKWFGYTCTYIHYFWDYFPIQVITANWVEFIVLYTIGPCFGYLIYIQQCMYVNSKFLIYLSHLHFPFGNHKFVFEISESVSVL